jgi:Family of unknown function (DUF5335)
VNIAESDKPFRQIRVLRRMTGEVRKDAANSGQELEIPSGDWNAFLNEFSRKNYQRIATVEVIGSEGEREVEVKERPFNGASYDEPGTGETRIFIGIADVDPENHLDHSVINPTRLRLVGNGDDLKVYSADGSVTILRFARAADSTQSGEFAA